MKRFWGNVISVCYSFVRFSLMKLVYKKRFEYHVVERFSPNVVIKIWNDSVLKLGKKVRVHSGSRISTVAGGVLKIGDDCRINYNCMIVCRHSIDIGNGVEFGPNVLVYDHDHDFKASGGLKKRQYKLSPVIIGDHTWVGANSVILRGTKIGKNCVISAGSVVKDDIPDNTVFIQKRQNSLLSY